jgi:hypothetical protein
MLIKLQQGLCWNTELKAGRLETRIEGETEADLQVTSF